MSGNRNTLDAQNSSLCRRLMVRHKKGVFVLIGVFVLQGGCVTTAPSVLTSEVRESLGVTVIAPAQYVPKSNFNTFAKSAGSGAAKGAIILGGGTAAGTAVTAASVIPMIAPVVVFTGILTSMVASAAGAVEGARAAVPAETAQQVESVINSAVAGLDAQNQLAVRLATVIKNEPWIRLSTMAVKGPASATENPDYKYLQADGINTTLEIAITEIGFESCGPEFVRRMSSVCPDDLEKRMVDLFLSMRVRLVRVSDGAELHVRQMRYKSALREIPRWVSDDGKLLAQEFEHAYQELAERVLDDVLLVAPISLPTSPGFPRLPGPGNPDYGICWLAPVYPKAQPVTVSEALNAAFSKPADVCPASGLHIPVVDSVRPRLQWSAFPRHIDRQLLDPAILNNIHDVTYDLKIWQVEGCERGWLVYQRDGLESAEHTLEESLAPASRYFWSVRARFTLNGHPMATRWSHFDALNCYPNDITDWQYHRFATPAEHQG